MPRSTRSRWQGRTEAGGGLDRDACQLRKRNACRRQRVADAPFELRVFSIEIGAELGGPAQVRSRREDAERARAAAEPLGVDRMGRLTGLADDREDLGLGEVKDWQPVVDLAARDTHALVAPPGDALRTIATLVAAQSHGIDEAPAEAGIRPEKPAKLPLDRSGLEIRRAPARFARRPHAALLDALEERFPGCDRREDEGHARRNGVSNVLDRALPFGFAERGVDRHELGGRDDARQQDGHCLAVLASARVHGDESACANHLPAPWRHGKIGDAAGHGSVLRRWREGPLPGPGMRPAEAGHCLSPSRPGRRGSPGPCRGRREACGRGTLRTAAHRATLRPRRGSADNGRTAMVGDVPVRVCLDELRDSAEPDAARVLARERGSALLGSAGVASGLVAVAVDEQDGDSQHSLELFEALIELARMDDESRGRLGARFLQEAATSVEALALLDGLAPAVTHGLTMAYARAEVEAPPALVERLMGQIGPLRETGQLPFDPDTEIESLRPVLESEPWALHGILDERIGVFPDVARAAFAFEVACRDEEACGRIALYWLLDRSEEVRFGAAEGFLERALRGIVEPVSAALVPLLRSWMPADPARAVLDGALREARRRGRFAPLAHSEWRPKRFVATLPDRVGSQAFVVLLEGGAEPAAASVVIKAGRGIGEAFIVSGAGPMAAMPGQDGDGELFDVPRDAFEAAIAAAIAEGLESGRPPPAGLIDVVRACGLRDLRPRTMTARDWLEEVDPEGHIARLPAPERDELVEASAAWPERYPEVEAWSEGTAVMQQALEDGVSSEGLAAAFWVRVEETRNDWARIMLRAAQVLKGAGEDDWRSFAATAMSLLDGRPLATVPVPRLHVRRNGQRLAR